MLAPLHALRMEQMRRARATPVNARVRTAAFEAWERCADCHCCDLPSLVDEAMLFVAQVIDRDFPQSVVQLSATLRAAVRSQ